MPEHTPSPEAAAARRQLAALCEARGETAPTLGWVFGDTPGAPSRDDGVMAVGVVDLEAWVAS